MTTHVCPKINSYFVVFVYSLYIKLHFPRDGFWWFCRLGRKVVNARKLFCFCLELLITSLYGTLSIRQFSYKWHTVQKDFAHNWLAAIVCSHSLGTAIRSHHEDSSHYCWRETLSSGTDNYLWGRGKINFGSFVLFSYKFHWFSGGVLFSLKMV